LGFAYIVEKKDMDARGISFEGFRQFVPNANVHLPPTLDYGGRYQFNMVDGRKVGIWFEFVEQKFTPRVVDMSDPVENFATLPLVSGEYMRAPGGHDGLIEIRQPGCEGVPLILDYRVATNPVREENRVGCPGPWVDRVIASFDASRRFFLESQPAYGHSTRVGGADLYDELLRLDTDIMGPRLAPAVISALAAMGVDFSVPESDLKDWLANPLFTPYPSLAQALLGLGVNLKAPVFVDVIAFNYENTSGVPSPRQRSDVRQDVLRAAIVEGWNVRYGEGLRPDQFGQIVI
jgi:hypothetical protein